MVNRCFVPYIIGTFIVVILAVSFIVTRAYQRHVEMDAAHAEAPNRSVKERHVLEPHEREMRHGHSHDEDAQNKSFEPGPYIDIAPSEEEDQENKKNKEFLELMEWIQTGKLTPYVAQELKRRAEWRRENDFILDVIQRVVTPDGSLHQVVVPRFQQYEEGDAILKSELVDDEYLKDYYGSGEEKEMTKGDAVIVNNVTYPMPDEYYAIESPYEQLEYVNKFMATIELGISMAEVEQKVASGKLDVSLDESEKEMLDRKEARLKRRNLLDLGHPKMPPLSDTPPVKVSFLADEGENTKPEWSREPGWSRKSRQQHLKEMSRDAGQPEISEYEDGIGDVSHANDFSFAPEFSSEQPEGQRFDQPKRAMGDYVLPSPPVKSIETNAQVLPEERIKEAVGEQLSPERLEKALSILNQYGPEEGLRRLRQADSEVATQLERHSKHADAPPPTR